MLPEREGFASGRLWMAGLVNWAISQAPPVEDFSREWWALKGLYPRMPSYWRRFVQETLQQNSSKGMPDELKDWWQQDARTRDGTNVRQKRSPHISAPKLPTRSAMQSLLQRADNAFLSVRNEIEALVNKYQHYAEVTGDSYYLVRTACNIGMALLVGTDDSVNRGQLAVDLARRALTWQPTNVYGWALWRDALATQGALEAAELVGWETIRRFPENEQWRNQLALLLGDLPGREADAEELLRETIQRFPDDVFARTQLALLLGDLPGRHSDAEQLLRETIQRFPDDVIARDQLAELLIALDRVDEATGVADDVFSRNLEDAASFDLRARLVFHSGDIDGARDILLSGTERYPTNLILCFHLQTLDDGKPLPLKAQAYRTADAGTPDTRVTVSERAVSPDIQRRGQVRRLLFEYGQRQGDKEWRETALGEVRRILSEDSNLAYANFLGQELEGRGENTATGNTFALAFVDALKKKDAERFAQLENSFSRQSRFVDVAKAFLFRDQVAADRAIAWLKQEDRSESRSVSALRGFLSKRFDVAAMTTGDAFIERVVANDNVQADLIESALAGDELLLAA